MKDPDLLVAGLGFLAFGALFIFRPDVADYLHDNFGFRTGPKLRRPFGAMALTIGTIMFLIWVTKQF
jgi:hypothetical protein